RDVATADPGFQALDLLLQPPVGEYGRIASLLIVDQVLADEDIASLARLNGAIVDPPSRCESQAIQRDSLERCNEAARSDPMRLGVGPLEQVRPGGFDP